MAAKQAKITDLFRRLIVEDWFQSGLGQIRDHMAQSADGRDRSEEMEEVFQAMLEGARTDHGEYWRHFGEAGIRWIILSSVGSSYGIEPAPLRYLLPDANAIPFTTTAENVERVRAEMQPGQLWVRVRGPGIDKIAGYLEWQLRELAEQGYDVNLKPRGRLGLPDDECIEAARLQDAGSTYAEIGRHFNWPLQPDAYGKPGKRCRTAEKAVKRGRDLHA